MEPTAGVTVEEGFGLGFDTLEKFIPMLYQLPSAELMTYTPSQSNPAAWKVARSGTHCLSAPCPATALPTNQTFWSPSTRMSLDSVKEAATEGSTTFTLANPKCL